MKHLKNSKQDSLLTITLKWTLVFLVLSVVTIACARCGAQTLLRRQGPPALQPESCRDHLDRVQKSLVDVSMARAVLGPISEPGDQWDLASGVAQLHKKNRFDPTAFNCLKMRQEWIDEILLVYRYNLATAKEALSRSTVK